jgi:hypothetical protein
MKHWSKDWPVFDGQVIHYIAWKREWRAHHQENYLGLQGDALRQVLVERCLRPADKEPRCGNTWIEPTNGRMSSCMT